MTKGEYLGHIAALLEKLEESLSDCALNEVPAAFPFQAAEAFGKSRFWIVLGPISDEALRFIASSHGAEPPPIDAH